MICENVKCGKEHDGSFASGRFCSLACSKTRVLSKELKDRISYSLRVLNNCNGSREEARICRICKNSFFITWIKTKSQRKCCDKCVHDTHVRSGKKIGPLNRSRANLRSKNEIYFAELCREKFVDVETNVPIFNGFDADVIIHDIKVAIMWDGPWHWRELGLKNVSLKQIKNRDKIKISNILKFGYSPLSIIDCRGANKKFVEIMFESFIKNFPSSSNG